MMSQKKTNSSPRDLTGKNKGGFQILFAKKGNHFMWFPFLCFPFSIFNCFFAFAPTGELLYYNNKTAG